MGLWLQLVFSSSYRSVEVNLLRVKGKSYSLVISDLFSPIVPEQSSIRVSMCALRLCLPYFSWPCLYVSGFEKRAHFAQNAKMWQFSTYHNLKASGLVYRYPTLLLKKSNVRKGSYLPTWNGGAPTEGIKRPIFRPRAILTIGTPKPEVGGARNLQQV